MDSDNWTNRDRKIKKRRTIKQLNSVHKVQDPSSKDDLKKYRREYEKLLDSFESAQRGSNGTNKKKSNKNNA
jgi:hypothetical protein